MLFSAAAAAIHSACHGSPLVLRLLLAAKPTDIFTIGQPNPVVIFIAHFTAPHACATVPLMGCLVVFITNGTFSQALPLHKDEPVFSVTLRTATCALAGIPAMAQ